MTQPLESSSAFISKSVSRNEDGYLIEELIPQIQAGHESAACQLREFLTTGVHWYLRRRSLPENSVEATCRQVLDSVIRAIEAYDVSTASELVSLTRTTAKALTLGLAGASKNEALDGRQVDRMKKALHELGGRERDALMRYFEGHHPDRICSELGMTSGTLAALQVRIEHRYMELG